MQCVVYEIVAFRAQRKLRFMQISFQYFICYCLLYQLILICQYVTAQSMYQVLCSSLGRPTTECKIT